MFFLHQGISQWLMTRSFPPRRISVVNVKSSNFTRVCLCVLSCVIAPGQVCLGDVLRVNRLELVHHFCCSALTFQQHCGISTSNPNLQINDRPQKYKGKIFKRSLNTSNRKSIRGNGSQTIAKKENETVVFI